jgi:alpha-mannosidase
LSEFDDRRNPASEAFAEHGLRHFFVVPHTHWDREWYRPFEEFRLRLGEVVDGVIGTLESDDDFPSFTLDGQAVVLEDYLDIRPENEARLRALMAAGRIEVGPSYVLPDEVLVGGESLVRNLLLGREVCRRFGVDASPVGYMPDSFGHPLALPQILAGFGLDGFIFSRGLGDEVDEVGLVFRWRAPDGSEVLALQQLPDYSNFAAVTGADDAVGRIRAIAQRFGPTLQDGGVHDVLLSNGSDHLPVQPELPRLCAELQRRCAPAKFTIARHRDYVRAVGSSEPVAVYEGELLGSRLWNVLRGVNSARLYIKQANERAERRLLSVETLTALRTLRGGDPFPSSDFRLAWRELLRCHPHDSICGCSCDEVPRDMLVRYESLHRTLDVLQDRALDDQDRSAQSGRVAVVNPLPYRRRTLIERPGAEPVEVELDGFAARVVELAPARDPCPGEGTSIETDHFRIDARPDGTLTLLDKRHDRRFEHLHELQDEPDAGDLYNFCPVDGAPPWCSESGAVRVLRDGPMVYELELSVQAERPAGLQTAETCPLTVVTAVRLVRGSARVEFRTRIDNRTRDHRLRVAFAGGDTTVPVRAEGQFALVRRPAAPPPPKTDWVEPPDSTQHTLGAVAVGPLALLTKGLPEYEALSDGRLCLTLLRCVGIISQPTGAIVTRPLGAGPQVPTPEGQCLGRHEMQYALLTDADTLDDVALLRASQDYRFGPMVVPPGASFESPLAVDGDVVFSCLKGAEDGDGLILRCFNPAGSPVCARVAGPVSVFRTRLDETGERPLPDGVVKLGPHQIATLRLRA